MKLSEPTPNRTPTLLREADPRFRPPKKLGGQIPKFAWQNSELGRQSPLEAQTKNRPPTTRRKCNPEPTPKTPCKNSENRSSHFQINEINSTNIANADTDNSAHPPGHPRPSIHIQTDTKLQLTENMQFRLNPHIKLVPSKNIDIRPIHGTKSTKPGTHAQIWAYGFRLTTQPPPAQS